MSRDKSPTPRREHAKSEHDRAKLEHDALVTLVKALGELPHNALDQASFKAYSAAAELLDPDEFTARFMAQARKA